MEYSYKFNMTPSRLAVAVHVGINSEFNLRFPHLWTGPDEAEVWFPSSVISHSDVAHEGVHLITWAMEELTKPEWLAMVPRNDMARKGGVAAQKEEAQARMMDRYIDTFYRHAQVNRLVLVNDKGAGRQ